MLPSLLRPAHLQVRAHTSRDVCRPARPSTPLVYLVVCQSQDPEESHDSELTRTLLLRGDGLSKLCRHAHGQDRVRCGLGQAGATNAHMFAAADFSSRLAVAAPSEKALGAQCRRFLAWMVPMLIVKMCEFLHVHRCACWRVCRCALRTCKRTCSSEDSQCPVQPCGIC